ncbi:heat shock protein, Hsp20 family protein [Minicystis rosea]|nr:heat shock protein, Hsp20 family protein [Minicystis rosea]
MSIQTISKQTNDKVEKLAPRPTYAPPVDIYENKDEILIFADLPGVAQDQLSIHYDKDELTIEAQRPKAIGTPAYDFKRTFVVPRGIDPERIVAAIQNGVLKLTLPKSSALKPRQIPVNSA